jgi:hypothetical protein
LAGKLPLGEIFMNNPKKQILAGLLLQPNFFCRVASFEPLMTKIGLLIMDYSIIIIRLFDSTFKLEIPIHAPK